MINIILVLFGLFVLFVLLVRIAFAKEIKAAREKDPAARNAWQIIFLYPGFHAIVSHRMAHFLWILNMPFFSRALSQLSRFFTGIEIHPGAQIGQGFFIDHGMGVVIGETTIVGNNVTLFQGVTLGGTGKETGKRHPTLGSNIVVGSGAKILGNIAIGDNSYIGANAVIIHDVPPNSTVVGVPGRVTKQDGRKIDTMMDHVHILDPVKQQIDELQKRIDSLENELKRK
ncbi:MAG: serine O-acetyltransferase EpsC [Candidatus Omnitrophota bacterium]